tara:strand:- start:9040 stop:9234 length:195 start_codon:yes stop_codon:yes gene_type:complete
MARQGTNETVFHITFTNVAGNEVTRVLPRWSKVAAELPGLIAAAGTVTVTEVPNEDAPSTGKGK